MQYIDFLAPIHKSTKRDYLERVAEHDKAACASVAKQFGRDYWDGDRRYGYGGYTYDGRWAPVAKALIDHYDLGGGSRVGHCRYRREYFAALVVGCSNSGTGNYRIDATAIGICAG